MSVRDQQKAIDAYAQKNGLEILRYFIDEGRSGRSAEDRPSFMQMISHVKDSDEFKYILCYDNSRWGRFEDDEEGAMWRVTCRKYGKIPVYIGEASNDSLVRFVKDREASEYSKNLSKVSYRGHRTYASMGCHVGGQAKFGFKRLLVDESGKPVKVLEHGEHKALKTQHTRLVVGDPLEVETVRKIYDLYVNKGYGTTTITNILNKEGVPPPKRRPVAMSRGWSKSTVWYILHDPTYCGHIIYNKKVYKNMHEGDKGWGKRKPESEWVVCKNAHEAIISEELFNAVKSKPHNPNFTYKGKGRGQYSPYLLTGLIRCRNCNGQYQGRRSAHYSDKKDYETFYYVCGSYVMRGKHICQSWSIPKDVLERFAVDRIKRVVSNPADITKMKDKLKARLEAFLTVPDKGIEDVEKELNEVSTKIDNLVDAVSNGFDRGIATAKINELKARRDSLTKMKAERQPITPVNVSQYVNRVETYMKDYNRTFERATITKKKDMIRSCLGKIEVDPNGEKVYYYFRKSPVIDNDLVGNNNNVFSGHIKPSPPFCYALQQSN